jgi:ABC-type Fe3+ transport system substrate-binding protein
MTKREVETMIKKYQVTLFNPDNKYKPVSAIVTQDTSTVKELGNKGYTQEIKTKGIKKICNKRYWTGKDLTRYGYTKVKVREYDKDKIAAENKARYEAIKQERGWS